MIDPKLIVVAFGGNAVYPPTIKGTAQEQLDIMAEACEHLVPMFRAGYRVVITHGNGPAVGNILFRMALTSKQLVPMPMDVCVAHSQGGIGYMLQQSLANVLARRGLRLGVSSIVTEVEVAADDAWIRDHGPTFVVDGKGGRRGVDWRFNAWGGIYQSWDRDERVAAEVLEIEGADRYRAPIVLEGGSIHVDGEGTVLSTEECLLNPNRNPELSKEQIERVLLEYLGAEKVVWLGAGVFEDETDGHVDNLACFARPGTVLLTWTDDDGTQIVGEEHKGWSVTKYLLEFERGGGSAAPSLIEAIDRIRAAWHVDDILPTEAALAARLDALETQVHALEMTELRCLAETERRGSPGAASSMLKIKATELSQQITEVALEAAAYYGQPYQPETNESHGHIAGIGPDAALTTSAFYFNNRAASIYGGSNEIQRNIIAKAVLGL